MCHVIMNTTTDIIVFLHDDAVMPSSLPYILTRFEDRKVGSVGMSKRVQLCEDWMSAREVLAGLVATPKYNHQRMLTVVFRPYQGEYLQHLLSFGDDRFLGQSFESTRNEFCLSLEKYLEGVREFTGDQ
jgi:hypothetical protein